MAAKVEELIKVTKQTNHCSLMHHYALGPNISK